jgi:hypothetical protein
MTDNPYVEAQMAMDGPVHRGEIHAAAIRQVGRTPEIGPDELHLLDRRYQDWIMVDEAIANVGDRVANGRGFAVAGAPEADEGGTRIDLANQDCLFAMAVDQRACRAWLEEAWAVVHRIEEEMRRDRRVTALTVRGR